MKIYRITIVVWALFLIAAGLLSCGGGSKLSTMEVTPANPMITKQGSPAVKAQFTATETLADNSMSLNMTSLVSWVSSDPTKATIAIGLATPLSAGSTIITATDSTNDISNTAVLTVVDQPVLTAIVLDPATVNLASNGIRTFKALWNDISGIDMTDHVNWSSSDTTIATVTSTPGKTGTGVATLAASLVTGVTVTITATDPVTGIAGTAVITVQN
jgi:hypothetical protein